MERTFRTIRPESSSKLPGQENKESQEDTTVSLLTSQPCFQSCNIAAEQVQFVYEMCEWLLDGGPRIGSICRKAFLSWQRVSGLKVRRR